MNYIKQNHLSILIILWLVVTSLMGSDIGFGAINREITTITNPQKFTQGFYVGTTTSAAPITSSIIHGTCSLVSDSSIAATSTGTGTCAAVGAQAGDQVFVSLATTTTKIAAQWALVGTVAGSNTVTVRLLNLTGTAAVPSATNGFGSSTQYWIVR